jgi:hypothetical protein
MTLPTEIELYYKKWEHLWDASHEHSYLERNFVENVFCPSLSTAELVNLVPQFPFKDQTGKNRRIDFVLHIDEKKLAIELDGFGKLRDERGGVSRKEFDDFLFRQNSLLEYVDDFMRFTYEHIINEAENTQKILAKRVERHKKNEITPQEVKEIIRLENEKLKHEIVLYSKESEPNKEVIKIDLGVSSINTLNYNEVTKQSYKSKEIPHTIINNRSKKRYNKVILFACIVLSVLAAIYWVNNIYQLQNTLKKPEIANASPSAPNSLTIPTVYILGFAPLPQNELEDFSKFLTKNFGNSVNLSLITDNVDNGKIIELSSMNDTGLKTLTQIPVGTWNSISYLMKSIATKCTTIPNDAEVNVIFVGSSPKLPPIIAKNGRAYQGIFFDKSDWEKFNKKPKLKFFSYYGNSHKLNDFEKEFKEAFDYYKVSYEVVL